MADTNLNANSSVVPKMEESNYRDTPGNAEIERLVAKLDSMKNGKPEQLLMVTSALLGEGKSTVSTKIAISSARNRKGPDCRFRYTAAAVAPNF
jgi:Mrp family chromosome partitioning ATPase